MFKPVRVIATVVFLASIALVFVGAFVIRNEVRPCPSLVSLSHWPFDRSYASVRPVHRVSPLSLPFPVFVVVEYLAYTWYCLSYIPYARSAVLKVVGLG